MKLSRQENKLIIDTIQKCIDQKISFSLKSNKSFDKSSGYVNFKSFVCCYGEKEIFIESFLHESCHLDQLSEKNSVWYDPLFLEHKDLDIFSITNKKKNKSKKYEDLFKKTVELELDCDKRSINKAKKYNLNINTDNYIQRSNFCLMCYYPFYQLKCWIFPPVDHKLISSLPTKFLSLDDYWKKNDTVYNFIKSHLP